MVSQKYSLFVLFLVGIITLSSCSFNKTDVTVEQTLVDEKLLLTLPKESISYVNAVKPILERRCVSCHACYDSPCQLKLSSMDGILRGASKKNLYDINISGTPPTRLNIDAKTTKQWREKGFSTVLNEGVNTPRENLEQSVFYQMLRLKQTNPQSRVGMLSNDFDLALDRNQVCPDLAQFPDYRDSHPTWGMPYAMPNLTSQEYKTLVQWLAQGSPVEEKPKKNKKMLTQISQWEQFLNGNSNKEKLSSRYIFEHLYLAHIHFANSPDREFYRLVRSTTPTGQVIDEIASVFPFDDPGSAPFYYRLKSYDASIVVKNHIVYEFSPQKMARYKALFIDSDYKVNTLPSYDTSIAANPFKVFQAIPANTRYRFLLDDAKFFIEGFIKGPSCRGQVALNVIEDQFWVFFLNPDHYINSNDSDFLKDYVNDLTIPSELGDDTLNLIAGWTTYREKVDKYWNAKKSDFLKGKEGSLTQAMESVWDGKGTNPNAALTIFRHLNSASVDYGLLGDAPETAWVIDYPLFERIHYLLVAGYNLYGNVGHHFNARIYMDFLRMEAEDNFVAYLPANKRKEILESWYVGIRGNIERAADNSTGWLDKELVIGYKTDDPQTELYQHLKNRIGNLADSTHTFYPNKHSVDVVMNKEKRSLAEIKADNAMEKISEIKGALLQVFPELVFLRIRNTAEKNDFVYTLIHNKSYKHVSSMLADASEDKDIRDLEHASLTVVKGLLGAYPNFFFDVELNQIDNFVERYTHIKNRKDYEQFVELFGVRRTNTEFWAVSDWFQDYADEQQPVLSGLFDLNRYHNR